MKLRNFLTLTLLVTASAVSSVKAAAPDLIEIDLEDNIAVPDRFQFCAVCHGSQFQGNTSTDSPNLSILSSWYLESQLQAYKHQIRGVLKADTYGREMQPMLTGLDNNAIFEISALISAIKPPDKTQAKGNQANIKGNITRGRNLYQSCASCHGTKGLGKENLRAPRLAGQLDWYLVRQLNDYQRGLRGMAKRDRYGTQMREATSTLSGRNSVQDVVAYINTLSSNINK